MRYLERVLEDRKVRKAPVTSTDIILGNKDRYPERTVEQQEQLAEGRPVDPVAFEDLGLRGTDDAGFVEDDSNAATPQARKAASARKSASSGKSASDK